MKEKFCIGEKVFLQPSSRGELGHWSSLGRKTRDIIKRYKKTGVVRDVFQSSYGSGGSKNWYVVSLEGAGALSQYL